MSKFESYYIENLELTKKKLRESVSKDLLIIKAANSLSDLKNVINILVTKLREWYSYYNPELEKEAKDNKKFVDLIIKGEKKRKNSIGGEFDNSDQNIILEFAGRIKQLNQLEDSLEEYIEKTMKQICPNLQAVAGNSIGPKLLILSGSLKGLSKMPASKIQLLGSEKAFFRYLISGTKSPKYGLLFTHELVQKSKNKGKIARVVANKISIAAKIDYFKGEFIGDKLRKQVEAKI